MSSSIPYPKWRTALVVGSILALLIGRYRFEAGASFGGSVVIGVFLGFGLVFVALLVWELHAQVVIKAYWSGYEERIDSEHRRLQGLWLMQNHYMASGEYWRMHRELEMREALSSPEITAALVSGDSELFAELTRQARVAFDEYWEKHGGG